MNFSEILKEKKQISDNIKNIYSLPKKNKAIGLIKIENKKLLERLQECLIYLPANFIIETSIDSIKEFSNIKKANNTSKLSYGFDFIVCDSNIENLNKFFPKGVIPIIDKNSYLSSILTEFDPLKSKGNSYLFIQEHPADIFYAIIRYLENFKFPFDNKNLVRNICEI